jgi:RNA polymerase sigma factor (TIGR02999 family)
VASSILGSPGTCIFQQSGHRADAVHVDPAIDLHSLLAASAQGDRAAFDALVALLYPELRRLAHRQLERGWRDGSWNTTALVHELYLKLAGSEAEYRDLAHFYAASARAMRHILVDFARRRHARKRGGPDAPLTLDTDVADVMADATRVLAVEEALSRLADLDPRLAQVVECKVFAGYSEEETAAALGLSLRSTQRCWQRARAWLAEEMEPR